MRKKVIDKKCLYIIIAALFIAFFYLIYNYSLGVFSSDYAAHIRHALRGEGYSLITITINLFCGLFNSKLLFSIFMALIITLTIVSCFVFVKNILKLMNIENNEYTLLISITSLFICSICIPDWSPFYYRNSLSTQSWHNSTYTMMRFFSLLTLSSYFVIQKNYINYINYKNLVIFTILLTLTNFSKPSFILAFAPIMLVVLIKDFIKTKTKSFKNAFLFGICVLISSVILIIQANLVFDAENTVAFSFSNCVSYFAKDKKFILYFVLNFAYPIYVTYLAIKNRKPIDPYSKNIFIQIWSMYILSFLEYMFIIEVGPRYADGNFGWGMQLFAYVLFVTCFCMEIKMKNENIINDIQFTIANFTYGIHIAYGVCYFALLCLGYNYMI